MSIALEINLKVDCDKLKYILKKYKYIVRKSPGKGKWALKKQLTQNNGSKKEKRKKKDMRNMKKTK